MPVTVLSRCQRYDLRRIDAALLAAHFAEVAKQEEITIDDEALRLLARAADGSARDGLSLLDQAIARGGSHVSGEQVRDMLGLADRGKVFDLFAHAVTGRPTEALDLLADLHRAGADALTLLQDLLDITHKISRYKVVPSSKNDVTLTSSEHSRLADLASGLSTPVLARAWQILLKGIPEVQSAPQPMDALEMLLIRLCHAGSLPTPGDLVKKLADGSLPPAAGASGSASGGPSGSPSGGSLARRMVMGGSGPALSAVAQATPLPQVHLADWRSAVALFAERKELQLYAQLHSAVECLRFAPGQVELYVRPGAAPALAPRVATLLQEWTGQRWLVNLARQGGQLTLLEEDEAKAEDVLREAAEHPLVKAVLLAFPGAKVEAVREKVARWPSLRIIPI